ncbi:MAG: hypothetical protein ABFS03_03140 [Chloroflexota bacterium]
MNIKLKSTLSTAIAISFGFVVLLGYFFSVDASGSPTMLGVLRSFFLQGAVILAGVALLVGIVNLITVHFGKAQTGISGVDSFVLILSFTITLGISIFEIVFSHFNQGRSFQTTLWIFNNIQLPIEISLMALLVVSLTYAAARLLTRRLTLLSIVFVGVVLFLLFGTVPLVTSQLPALSSIRAWILRIPAMAGARGILLGVALGTIATGIRILTGNDRPYGG